MTQITLINYMLIMYDNLDFIKISWESGIDSI
jgi:hypothetical protein